MTKGEINKLGERLVSTGNNPAKADLDLLQEYRQSFQAPVARVFATVLKLARRIDKQAIVTFRIKRLDTIIEKLIRNKDGQKGPMLLSRMWDVAGCRCIINTLDDGRLYDLLSEIKATFGEDSKVIDHIRPPKPDGYRSLHVYVKDVESGKRIEVQIRNRKQHNWATLVEIVDLLYGTHYKERGNQDALGRFLYLFSNAESLSDEHFSEMLKVEKENKVFEKMSEILSKNYLVIRRQWLRIKPNGAYYVITASKKGSSIESFPSFALAEQSYYNKFLARGDSNIVLTHLPEPDFNKISIAYSNYILAMHAFFDDYRRLVSRKIIECVNRNSYMQFIKDFNIYDKNLKYYMKNLKNEFAGMTLCIKDDNISRSQINKWMREVKERFEQWAHEMKVFLETLYKVSAGKPLYRVLVRNRINRLKKLVESE